LEYPPDDFNICPSCGVEFGYETAGRTFTELRQEWVVTGARWASRVDRPPSGWNPWLQLINGGYSYALPFKVQFSIESHQTPTPLLIDARNASSTSFLMAQIA
jgi:hypothetical protein